MKNLFSRLFHFRRRPLDQGLQEEIRFHLSESADLHRQSGLAPEAARDEARRRFGNATRIYEETRRLHVSEFAESGMQDIRYAFRGFRRNPLFALTAVTALALGIGAATAVFSVIDRVLFRPLPYAQENRLVSVGMSGPIEANEFLFDNVYAQWRRRQTPFEAMTFFTAGATLCDLGDDRPVRLRCVRVGSNFLDVLGVRLVVGPGFRAGEDRPNVPQVALLSHGLWQSRFGRDPAVVGRRVLLDGHPATVVGVLPGNFEIPTLTQADILVPQVLEESATPRDAFRVFARLKPGVSIAQAAAQLQPLFLDTVRLVPPMFRRGLHLRVRSIRDRQMGNARLASWILFGAVLSVLLIACSNVANLLLARSAQRRRELAVRAALGASRWRLTRQALTEALLLSLAGAMAGCGLAWLLLHLLVSIAPEGIIRLQEARLDGRVLIFAIGISILCGILFGLAPTLEIPRAGLLSGVRVRGPVRGVFRHALVVAQIAASLLLLSGATLLARSLWKMERVPFGIEPDHVLTAKITLSKERYPQPASQAAFFQQIESRLRSSRWVGAFALTDSAPPSGGMGGVAASSLEIEGRTSAESLSGAIGFRRITPEYFRVLKIPIVQGRSFKEQDRSAADVTILSRTLAHRIFRDVDPLGQRVRFSAQNPWLTVIGVAADVKNGGFKYRDEPEFYVVQKRLLDNIGRSAIVILRTTAPENAASELLRAEIAALDSTLPVTVETMRQRVSELTDGARFNAVLLGLFAATGTLLAALGLYGVVSFLVAERTAEFGVRMALGATPLAIVRLVLSRAARWAAVGGVIGFAGSLAATRLLRSLLFGVGERDPISLAAAAVLLAFVTLAAAWIPSTRAARLDPVRSLRHE